MKYGAGVRSKQTYFSSTNVLRAKSCKMALGASAGGCTQLRSSKNKSSAASILGQKPRSSG